MTSFGGLPIPLRSGAEEDCVSTPEGTKLDESGWLWESGTILFVGVAELAGAEPVGALELVGTAETSVVSAVVFEVSPSSGCHCDGSGDDLRGGSATSGAGNDGFDC